MFASSHAEHFFETDADQLKRQRRLAKAANQYGKPVVLKSKVLAVLADPASPSHVFVAESAGTARRVNVDDADARAEVFRGPTAPVTCLALGGADNQTLFSGCWDKTVWAFDRETRQLLTGSAGRCGRFLNGHTDFVKAVVCGRLGQDTHVLISGGADRHIVVWDIATGRRLHTLRDTAVSPSSGRGNGKGSAGSGMLAVQHLAIDPAATTADEIGLVSASSDPRIRRWRVRLDGWDLVEEGDVLPLADGATTAAAAPSPPQQKNTLLAHETTVYKVVFAEDYFRSGGGNSEGDDDVEEEIDLWTASGDGTAQCLTRLRTKAAGQHAPSATTATATTTTTNTATLQHGDHVRAIALTDTWVITAGRDENLQFWDRASGDRRATVTGHFDEVTDLAVLTGRRRVCSVSLDGTVRTWPLERAAIDVLVKQQKEDAERAKAGGADDDKGIEPTSPAGTAAAGAAGSMLTAEEEAELAELMDDDDD